MPSAINHMNHVTRGNHPSGEHLRKYSLFRHDTFTGLVVNGAWSGAYFSDLGNLQDDLFAYVQDCSDWQG